MSLVDWLERVGKEYRDRVHEIYHELSGEDLDDFLGDDNDA